MSTFEWKTDFCTGIDEMDKHHKLFFNYLNELEKAAGGNKGKEVIDRGIKQVENYIKYHFAEEENIFINHILETDKRYGSYLQEVKKIVATP